MPKSYQKQGTKPPMNKSHFLLLLLLTLLLSGCELWRNTPTPTTAITIDQVVHSGEFEERVETEVLPYNNCGNNSSLSFSISRERTLEQSIDLPFKTVASGEIEFASITLEAGAAGNIIAAIGAEYGQSSGAKIVDSGSMALTVEADDFPVYTVAWYEKWAKGYVTIQYDDEEIEIPYLYLTAAQPEIVNVEYRSCSAESETETPTVEPTTEPVLETIADVGISDVDVLGELKVEYPIGLNPGSSDTVFAQIYIPNYSTSLTPKSIDRIEIPPDAPLIIGQLNSHQATILIRQTMRVELSSPTVKVESLYPSTQQVNIETTNQPTFWAWTITAPEVFGRHVLTLRTYLDQDDIPVWAGSFTINVIEFTPTPAPTDVPTKTPTSSPTPSPTVTPTLTPTPLPPLKRVGDQLIDNSPAVFGALLTFIAAMAGIRVQYSKTQDKIDRLQEQLDKITKEKEKDRETLEREVARLKSIKWWQFWRK